MTLRQILIYDPAPSPFAFREVQEYLKLGLDVTINLHQRADVLELKGVLKEVSFVDIAFTEQALSEWFSLNRGISVLKMRRNVLLSSGFFKAREEEGSGLRLIAQSGSGVSHLQLGNRNCHPVQIVNTPGANAQAVAEFIIGSLLCLLRDLNGHYQAMEKGVWSKHSYPLGSELCGKSIGIVGVGRIGLCLARLANAFGMSLVGYGGAVERGSLPEGLCMRRAFGIEELVASVDIVSLHLPLNSTTKGLFDEKMLRLLKPGSILVNTSRGGIVDESALAKVAMESPSQLGGAIVDVFQQEGEAFASPLLGIPGIILTPHIGGSTEAALEAATFGLISKVRQFLPQ
jgi:phosphoglycerate dehydrogenase-like enzyme